MNFKCKNKFMLPVKERGFSDIEAGLLIVMFFIAVFIAKCNRYYEPNAEGLKFIDSGSEIYYTKDPSTGCEYIVTRYGEGVTPRIGLDGKTIGCNETKVIKEIK